jgi:hypothetical protein
MLPALKALGGAVGAICMMRPFFCERTTRASSGARIESPCLAGKGHLADARDADAASCDRPCHALVDERHICSLNGADNGFLNHSGPANGACVDAGNHAGHVLIGNGAGKAHKHAKTKERHSRLTAVGN